MLKTAGFKLTMEPCSSSLTQKHRSLSVPRQVQVQAQEGKLHKLQKSSACGTSTSNIAKVSSASDTFIAKAKQKPKVSSKSKDGWVQTTIKFNLKQRSVSLSEPCVSSPLRKNRLENVNQVQNITLTGEPESANPNPTTQ